ncbi:hypothetical protein [Anaerorhabdus sp.]|uniref:hypothetical protein n=1 Tax=Anaerorhabdus sp. TaxID=1872524 RepID=UPI002FCBD278
MTGMTLNYVLLATTGIYFLGCLYSISKGERADRRLSQPIFAGILFILVLIATLMGIDYMDFKLAIETGNWKF